MSTTTTDDLADEESAESAEDAFLRQLEFLSNGQFGLQWEELHPAQQDLIDRDTFVRCYEERIGGVDVTDVEIVDTYEEEVPIPGTDLRTNSTAVTAKVTLSLGGEEQSSTDTYHEFLVDGLWRWTVSDVSEYTTGSCGG